MTRKQTKTDDDDWDSEYWGIKLDESLVSHDSAEDQIAFICLNEDEQEYDNYLNNRAS